jgi:hypothetical protein
MRFISLPVISILSLLVVSGCATSSQQQALTAEIRQLREDVSELKETVAASKHIIALPPSSFFPSRSRNAEKMADIMFPSNPTEENLKSFINEIITASQSSGGISYQDPQISMLALVGADNLHLLVAALPDGSHGGMGGYYLDRAIQALVEDRHKELILSNFARKQRLVSVVLQMNWEKDARETLISELNETNGSSLSTDWIKAVAALKDPETYDALTGYLSKTSNPAYVYDNLRFLPGIQLEDAVAKAWAKAKASSNEYTIGSMAVIAASYGHQDAIEKLIEFVKNPPERLSSSVNPRLALVLYLDTKGTNEELFAWYEANKNSLVFDPESKKFKVKK